MVKNNGQTSKDHTYNAWLTFAHKLVLAIFVAILALPFFNDRIRVWLSQLLKSYHNWLIIESTIITLATFLLFYIFRVYRLRIFVRHASRDPFKHKITRRLQRIGRALLLFFIMSVPILFGASWYIYNETLRYTMNRFGKDQIGVLIADFREVALNDYIPHPKYSAWLKEEMPNLIQRCETPIDVAFASTPAFFTSVDEAVNYGMKMNAKIIVWGEVQKNNALVTIKPKLKSVHRYVVRFGSKFEWSLGIVSDQFEEWSLDGSTMTLDTVKVRLQDVLVLPIFEKLQTGGFSNALLPQFSLCTYERFGYLPTHTRSILSMYLGNTHYRAAEYSSAISRFSDADSLAGLWDDTSGAKAELRALLSINIARSYDLLHRHDSSGHYVHQAWVYDPLVVLKDSAIYVSFWRGLTAASSSTKAKWRDDAIRYWQRRPDSLIGNFIYRVSDHLKEEPRESFKQQYDSLYSRK